MSEPGYYRFPAICADTVVFVSEDDLWSVPAQGGAARRLTANLAAMSRPAYSPDGASLAFTGREEGTSEVFVMPAEGGPVRRVTFLGCNSAVLGWDLAGERILFASDWRQPFDGITVAYAVRPDGGEPEPLNLGPLVSLSLADGGRAVIGRNNVDPARWKRYRGGTAGEIWVDADGNGQFRRLDQLEGNVARPMWVGDRIYFVGDHEGAGNIYSCLSDGSDLQRHTHHADFYARFPSTDGKRIVYHAGADLYLLDPAAGAPERIEVTYPSPRVHRQRKFVDAARYLESYALHPQGHSLALNVRGRSFTLGNWEGAVVQQGGEEASTRLRLTRWLNDGKRVVAVSDAGGVERLEVRPSGAVDGADRYDDLDIGRPYEVTVSPVADQVLVSNHRNELLLVDLAERTLTVIERNDFGTIDGHAWSPDGRWVAYGSRLTHYVTAIKVWDRTTGETHQVTEPILRDTQPTFDPEGKYLYFVGARELNPVYDALHFELSFPKGARIGLIPLRQAMTSPFAPAPRPLADGGKPEAKPEGKQEPDAAATDEAPGPEEGDAAPKSDDSTAPKPVLIDLEGIASRVVLFPIPEGRYGQIAGLKGKVLFTVYPVEGSLNQDFFSDSGPKGTLEVFDFETLRQETLVQGVGNFEVTADGSTLAYRSGNRLRVVKAGAKPDDKPEPPGRRSGWIDLARLRVSVDPGQEWRQMAHEAWRLQREYFWTPDMSQVDWEAVWARYAPLVDRVNTRGEFSDLMWEMQGELGTSHAYEMGGDYRPEPSYPIGHLGADHTWDADAQAYRVLRLVQGAPGEPQASSPLAAPGVLVGPGTLLRAVNGRKLTREFSPQQALVHMADVEVALTVEDADGTVRDVTVRTVRSEFPARYREWVEANRRRVHEATGGRVGYVHIPDMGARGYAEFHRLYLAEVAFDGIIVDVRFNRGGHVSQLLIEKLARRRLGYDISRWGQPDPYPSWSVAGPLVALTNQWAGSDGDIFSHVFKLMKLGPLIGKRTWGGVVGIGPRNALADGSLTTQPEYSFWFEDVGWGVENYGTDPDIEVDITPQQYGAGDDPQMDKGLETVLRLLEESPPARPDFGNRPNLSPPPFTAPD